MYRRLPPAISLQEAAEGAPTLGSLMARARDTAERLKAVEGLIPPAMAFIAWYWPNRKEAVEEVSWEIEP